MTKSTDTNRARNHRCRGAGRLRWLRHVTWCMAAVAVVAASGLSARSSAQEMKGETRERVEQATVMVFTAISKNAKGDTPLSSGSGYFINSSGLFVTNNHVVDPTHMKSDEEKQRFHYTQGKLTWSAILNAGTEEEETYDATVVYQNETADQALVQAFDSDGEHLETPDYLPFLPESRLTGRMKVWALGFPGGDQQRSVDDRHPKVSISVGNVLQAPRTPGGRVRMVYTDVIARPGNSGGPMVNGDGYLVGTVTLMTKPKGREDSGGANYSALVPAKLTKDMVRYAYWLGKIPPKTDFLPFIDVLADESGRISIPEYTRQRRRDVLYFDNGDRIYGTFGGKTVSWESPLGTIEMPVESIAYVMHDEEDEGTSSLVLEGGNQIRGQLADDTFQFTPEGGTEREQETEGLVAIGFKTASHTVKPISGKVVVFDSDLSHLVLSDVSGQVGLSGRAGTVKVPLRDVDRIDVSPDDEDLRVLTFADGRRMTGEFEEAEVEAKIAATGTPIRFNLMEVSHATVQIRQFRRDRAAGLDLIGVLSSGDREVHRLARDLEDGHFKRVRSHLNDLLDPKTIKRMPKKNREQMALLDAVTLIREGKYDVAKKKLRKVKRSSDPNISAYAQACDAVLKRFGKEFEGKPLSDRAAFTAAGGLLSDELIRKARDFLADTRLLTGAKGEYAGGMTAAKKYEKAMRGAAVFGGTEADDVLVRVWKFATDVCEREINRIDQEIKESRGGGGGNRSARSRPSRRRGSGGGRGAQVRLQRMIDTLQDKREKAMESLVDYMNKRWDYGFRIEDADVQQLVKREHEEHDSQDDEP